MIGQLDTTLRRLFTMQVAGITSDSQVGFQPPDADWQTYVKNLHVGGAAANALNVYLVELRENRKLRSNERSREISDGAVRETPAPRRVDCHYLITAWSPADVTPALEPTLDEHGVLYDVMDVLAAHDPLLPSAIFAPLAAPAPLAGQELPVCLLPPEGFGKLAEFWGTMGERHRWKPCVHCIVTIALELPGWRAGPPVTTLGATVLQAVAPASFDLRFHLGGTVLGAGAPPQPVAGAWVELLDAAGAMRLKLVRADSVGRFVFADVVAGDYQIRASSAPLGATASRPIAVPEPSGAYDVQF